MEELQKKKVPKSGGFAKPCPSRHENFTFGHLETPICKDSDSKSPVFGGGEAFLRLRSLNFVVLTPNFFWEFSRM